MSDDETMALLARVRWLEAENQRLIERLAQAKADRDLLASEVRAWRYDVPCDTKDLVASDGTLTRLGEWIKLTDDSGALQRAKEDK